MRAHPTLVAVLTAVVVAACWAGWTQTAPVLTGRVEREVLRPSSQLITRVQNDMTSGAIEQTWPQHLAAAEQQDTAAWALLLGARQRWLETGSEADFSVYHKLCLALLGVDWAYMYLATNDQDYIPWATAYAQTATELGLVAGYWMEAGDEVPLSGEIAGAGRPALEAEIRVEYRKLAEARAAYRRATPLLAGQQRMGFRRSFGLGGGADAYGDAEFYRADAAWDNASRQYKVVARLIDAYATEHGRSALTRLEKSAGIDMTPIAPRHMLREQRREFIRGAFGAAREGQPGTR